MLRHPLEKRLDRLAQERWTRRAIRILLRSAWVALSVLCIGLGLQLLTGWTVDSATLIAVAMLCIAAGATLLLRRPMSPEAVARRLDHRFGLGQQLTTALEISARSDAYPLEGVAAYLVEHASLTTAQVHRYIRTNQRGPWMELLTLLAMLFLASGMFVITGVGNSAALPTAESLPDPALDAALPPPSVDQPVPPDSMLPGEGNALGQQGGLSPTQQQMAGAVADALRDQSATRPAAEQLDQGDTAGAAQSLRELADQADQLSPETRQALGNELREAADQMQGTDPALADQVRQSADAIQQDAGSADDGLENLADAVEQIGDAPAAPRVADGSQPPPDQPQQDGQTGTGGGAGNTSGEQRERPQSHERLNIDGVPLELESDGGGTSTDGETDQPPAGVGNFSRSDPSPPNPDNSIVQIGDDPLYIPPDMRDVVQEYFQSGQ